MYNNDYNEYDELEKIYYKRQMKKYFVYLFIIIVGIVVLYLLMSSFNNNKSDKVVNSSNLVPKTYQIKNKLNKENNNNKEKKEKLILNPIIPEIKNNFPVEKKYVEKKYLKKAVVKKESVKKEIKKEIAKVKKKEVNNKIVIKVSKEGYSLNQLIDNYNSFPSYPTAIKIATIYYNQENYHKCIEWAKKANNIDSQKEESWLLYAKSLVKMGNKKTAKKLLNAYLNIYGENEKIREYLRSIK